MSIEAMKKALEALENSHAYLPVKTGVERDADKAITELRQAIEEAEKREWAGLTDHELQVLDYNDPERGKLARAVDAKLKERNT